MEGERKREMERKEDIKTVSCIFTCSVKTLKELDKSR